MKMKIFAKLTLCVLSVSCAISVAACGGGGNNSHTHNYGAEWVTNSTHHWHECQNDGCNEKEKDKAQHSDGNADGKCDVCNYVLNAGGAGNTGETGQSITFAEFMQKHSDKAVEFVRDEVEPLAVSDRTVQNESWSIKANADDELTDVTIVYTYNVDDTKRAVEIANVKLNTPIDLDNIVDGNVDLTNNGFKIDRTTAFEFDAKENYDNQNILNAIYDTLNNSATTVKVFKEVESSNPRYRSFDFIRISNDKVLVSNITASVGDGTIENLLYAIGDSAYSTISTKSTTTLDGTNIYSTSYALENLGGTTIDPEKPTTDTDVVKALNDNCKEAVVKKCRGLNGYEMNKAEQGTWYVSKDADGNITQAEYAFNYTTANDSNVYYVGKVVFNSPVSVKDLQDGKLGNATYAKTYSFNYDPEIQTTRADLTNAICETLFGINDDATRVIVDKGFATDSTLGEIRRFTVMEITDKGVQEASIDIKNSSSDNGYISKLEDEKNYEVTNTNSYKFEGQKAVESAQTNTNTSEEL